MAFDLARKMSCDPIIFIGQDLSFPGGRTYVKGTYFEDEAKQDMSVEAFEKRFKTFTVEDIHGEKVKTNRQMFAYKEWFRTEFARTKSRVINATEGGILRENCELGIFEEVIGECLDETFDTYSTIQEAASRFDGYDLAKLRRALFEIIGSINHSIEICNEGIGIVRDTVNAVENMDTLPEKWCADIIKKLDKLRFELKDEISMKPFIETANQTGVLNFHRGYKKLNNQKFTRVLFSQVLDLYTDLYMSMGRTCRGVLPFFVKGFKSIEDESLGRKSDGVEECLTTN
jgi:hypothetical protein